MEKNFHAIQPNTAMSQLQQPDKGAVHVGTERLQRLENEHASWTSVRFAWGRPAYPRLLFGDYLLVEWRARQLSFLSL